MSENIQSERMKQIIDSLTDLDSESQSRLLRAAAAYFAVDLGGNREHHPIHSTPDPRAPTFTQRIELSPKDFLHQKQPATDVDRVACLAYYLAHYRDTPFFKTVDISALNTEAAQLKFSNTAFSVANTANSGLLVPAGKGQKQLSALGERYVDALPDRNAAREILANAKVRRKKRREKSLDNSSK